VINPGESDNDDGSDLVLWLENMLEEPSSPIHRPSCVRDWPKGCGPKAGLKPKRCKTKRVRRKGKAKAKEEKCWCKPCSKKRRVHKMVARRGGKSRREDGWIWRVGDCIGMDGWDPWPTGPDGRRVEEDRLSGVGRASGRDAREHTRGRMGARVNDACARVSHTRALAARLAAATLASRVLTTHACVTHALSCRANLAPACPLARFPATAQARIAYGAPACTRAPVN
ncbi:Unknown protein, partial [Striga hermonthica]